MCFVHACRRPPFLTFSQPQPPAQVRTHSPSQPFRYDVRRVGRRDDSRTRHEDRAIGTLPSGGGQEGKAAARGDRGCSGDPPFRIGLEASAVRLLCRRPGLPRTAVNDFVREGEGSAR